MTPRFSPGALALACLLALAAALAGCHGLEANVDADDDEPALPRSQSPAGQDETGDPTSPAPGRGDPSTPESGTPSAQGSAPPAAEGEPQGDEEEPEPGGQQEEPEGDQDPEEPPAGGGHLEEAAHNVTLGANETLELTLELASGFDTLRSDANLANASDGNATLILRITDTNGTILAEQTLDIITNGTAEPDLEHGFDGDAAPGEYSAVLEVTTGTIHVDVLRFEAEG